MNMRFLTVLGIIALAFAEIAAQQIVTVDLDSLPFKYGPWTDPEPHWSFSIVHNNCTLRVGDIVILKNAKHYRHWHVNNVSGNLKIKKKQSHENRGRERAIFTFKAVAEGPLHMVLTQWRPSRDENTLDSNTYTLSGQIYTQTLLKISRKSHLRF